MSTYIDDSILSPIGEVVMFATCQAWPIKRALQLYAPDFSGKYLIHLIESWDLEIDRILQVTPRADYFLAQTDTAGDAPARLERIKKQLKPDAKIILFPPIGFTPFWPTMFRDWSAAKDPKIGKQLYPWGDRFVLRHLKAGASKREIIEKYHQADFSKDLDLDRLYELWKMDSKKKDQASDVAVTDLIENTIIEQQTFFSPTHCVDTLILRLLDRILQILGLRRLGLEAYKQNNTLKDYELPIHRSISHYFGIKYIREDQKYLTMKGEYLTSEDFLSEYIDYEQNRISQKRDEIRISTSVKRIREMSNIGTFDQAISEIERAEKISPDSIDIEIEKTFLYIKQKEFDKAILLSDSLVQKSPLDQRVYYYACFACFYKGDYPSTVKYGLMNLRNCPPPHSHDVLIWIAGSFLRLNLAEIAIPMFQKAIEQRPESDNGNYGMALAKLRTKDLEGAKAAIHVLEIHSPQRLEIISEMTHTDFEILRSQIGVWPCSIFLLGLRAFKQGRFLEAAQLMRQSEREYSQAGMAAMTALCTRYYITSVANSQEVPTSS